jgi:hypothetical protein
MNTTTLVLIGIFAPLIILGIIAIISVHNESKSSTAE